MIEPTFETIIILLAFWLASIFFVLKYGPIKTKLLYVIYSMLLIGLILLDINRYFGSLLLGIGIILATPYVTKALRDLIPNI